MKMGKKRRKIFNLYNFVVVVCLIVIAGSLYIVLNRDKDVAGDLKEKVLGFTDSIKETFSNIFGGNDDAKAAESDAKGKTNSNNSNKNTGSSNKNNFNSDLETDTVIDDSNKTSGIKTSGNEITEEEAKKKAIAKFKELGEEEVLPENLSIKGILRGGEKHFEISTEKNSLEIKITTGEITRINNIPVN